MQTKGSANIFITPWLLTNYESNLAWRRRNMQTKGSANIFDTPWFLTNYESNLAWRRRKHADKGSANIFNTPWLLTNYESNLAWRRRKHADKMKCEYMLVQHTMVMALTRIMRSPGSLRDRNWLPTTTNTLGSLRLANRQHAIHWKWWYSLYVCFLLYSRVRARPPPRPPPTCTYTH